MVLKCVQVVLNRVLELSGAFPCIGGAQWRIDGAVGAK